MHPLTSSPSPQSSPSDNSSISLIELSKRGLAPANFLEGVVVERLNHQPEKYHIGCMERIARIIITVELILITLFIIIPLVIYLSITAVIILITCIVMLYLFLPLPKPKLKGLRLFLGIFIFPLGIVWNLLRSLLHPRSEVEVWEYRISSTNNSAPFDGFFVMGKLAPRTLSSGDEVRVWVSKRHGRPIFRRGEVLINGRRLPLHVVEERRAVRRWTFSAVLLTAFFILIFYITYLSSSLQNYGGAT